MTDFVFVLGAPNNKSGKLSEAALARVRAAASLWHEAAVSDCRMKIVPTGGLGEHFNTSNRPHWQYVREALFELDVPEDAVADRGLESANTVEDIALIVDFLAAIGSDRAIVVTSRSHIKRSKFVFRSLAPDLAIDFIGAVEVEDSAAEEHEARSIERLQAQGGVYHAERFFPYRGTEDG